MAVVKITYTLKNEIKKHIDKIFDKKRERIKPDLTKIDSVALYNYIFSPDMRKLMYELPESFFHLASSIKISKISFDDDTPELHVGGIDIPFANHLRFPKGDWALPTFSKKGFHWAGGTLRLTGDYASLNVWVNDFKQYSVNKRALTEQLTLTKESVNTVLNNVGSLGPALKVMPALWDLLPDDVKARYKSKSVRSGNKKREFDKEAIAKATAVIAASKLGI